MKKLKAVTIEQSLGGNYYYILLRYSVFGLTYEKVYKEMYKGEMLPLVDYNADTLIPKVREILNENKKNIQFPTFFKSER